MTVEFTTADSSGTLNPKWSEYQNRFSSLPEYYFRTLDYPRSPADAEKLLGLIQLEMNSIDAQFIERRAELETVSPATLAAATEEHGRWKVKALRALRMKEAQITILQAWLSDNSEGTESRLEKLESRNTALNRAFLKLLTAVELSDSDYAAIIQLLN